MNRRTFFAGALIATTLCASSLTAGHRNHWSPRGQVEREEPVIITEQNFTKHLSDYHRKRYTNFTPAQKQAAFNHHKAQSISPDAAVEQISHLEYLRS